MSVELPKKPIWDDEHGYVFWRAALSSLQVRARKAEGEDTLQSIVRSIASISTNARKAGEIQIAVMFDCLHSLVLVDFVRDFGQARIVMENAVNKLQGISHPSVLAYCYDTYGDALRCDGKDSDATYAYKHALKTWPEYELNDRAESHLMLGIAFAKQEKYEEGSIEARKAAGLYLVEDGKGEYGSVLTMSAARARLESAGFLIHAGEQRNANDDLMAVYDLIAQETPKNTVEWAALGNVCWALVGTTEKREETPPPPVPGFTLGSGISTEDLEKMKHWGPTIFLGRSCAAVGLNDLALNYFEIAFASCESDEEKSHVAILALDSAIDVKDYAKAVRYAAMGSAFRAQSGSEIDARSYLVDFSIGRVIQLITSIEDKDVAIIAIKDAVVEIESLGIVNPSAAVLLSTLKAYREMLVDGNDVQLRSAYEQAVKSHSVSAARDIAWNWCYRHSPGKPVMEDEYFRWHWRLCWQSLEIGSQDEEFISKFLEQERQFWRLIPSESRSVNCTNVLETIEKAETLDAAVLRDVINVLAIAAWSGFAVDDVAKETANQLTCASTFSMSDDAVDAMSTRLLELVLHPGAGFVLEKIEKDVVVIAESLAQAKSLEATSEIGPRIQGVLEIANVLKTQQPTPAAFHALASNRVLAHSLSTNAAAQFYVWLTHFGELGRDDVFGTEQIMELLNSSHVSALLQEEELLPYMKIRLGTCYFTAKAFAAQREFGTALAEINAQAGMQMPFKRETLETSDNKRDKSLETILTSLSELEKLEATAREAELNQETWSCCAEQAGIRHMTGAAYKLQAGKNESNIELLRQAASDYLRTVDAAKEVEHSPDELILRAAFSGRVVATFLEDTELSKSFTNEIETVRKKGDLGRRIAELEQKEKGDILFQENSTDDFLLPDNEESIQMMVDFVMQSSGFPEDRRRFVEDDIRKLAESEKEKQDFCRFLQPLQNLTHTQSPHTAYTQKTKYTCSCELLGFRTMIETDDISVAINAMKVTYCNGCEKRKPRGSEGDD